jgi:cobalt-zinc-cadmium efflux system outer membrane protein
MGPQRRIFTWMLVTAAAAPVAFPASPQEPYPSASPPAAQAAAPASQAGEPPITLGQAFALAAANDRAITAARLRRAVDQAGIDVARGRPNPDLRYEQAKETPHQSLTASQPIELGGKRGRRIAVAQAVARTGEAELALTLAEVRAQVRRAYYGLAAAQARVVIALDLQALAGRAHDAARERFEAGEIARLEVLQADLLLSQAENEAAAIGGEREASRAELNVLIGRGAAAPTQVVEELGETALPAAEAAATAAMAGNAELAVLDRQVAEAAARAALARAQQVPDPTVEGAVTHDAPGEFVWGWRYAVGITVPLFTRHHAAVRVEEATLAQLRALREALVQKLEGAVGAALARAVVQRQQYIRYRDFILPQTREVEAMAEESYRSGQTGLPALLQALQSAREARAKAVQAAFDYQIALAELERAAAVGPPP